MPSSVYNARFGCWIAEPFPDAAPEYDPEDEEIDYPSDSEDEDEEIFVRRRPRLPALTENDFVEIFDDFIKRDDAAKVIQKAWRSH